MASTARMASKPIVFKFHGVPSKLRFHDDHVEIRDIDLGHTDLGEFLRIYNKPTKRSAMVYSLIHFRLLKVALHPISV